MAKHRSTGQALSIGKGRRIKLDSGADDDYFSTSYKENLHRIRTSQGKIVGATGNIRDINATGDYRDKYRNIKLVDGFQENLLSVSKRCKTPNHGPIVFTDKGAYKVKAVKLGEKIAEDRA